MTPDLSVRIGSLVLKNPVGVASGTFGYGAEYESLVDINSLGALYTKAVTVAPRPGNDIPRIVETPSGMLNSIGLANPGLDVFVAKKLAELSAYDCAVIVNVAGSSEAEYGEVVRRIEGADSRGAVAAYEINVSCPNVKCGGLSFGTEAAQVERLTASLKSLTAKPLIVKLTPNVTDIGAIARAAEAGGADAISCINTLVGMVIDTATRSFALAMRTGGLSGPAIRPVGVACVYKASRAVKIPVIGLGGIMCADDAIQYLLAGARAVQVGTGTFVDPRIPVQVLSGIEDYMKAWNIGTMAGFEGLMG